jgi:DNA-binding NtrC family response regulator
VTEGSGNTADSGNADADHMNVLVVDDEPIIRDLLRAMLGNMGVSAGVAENGIEAQRKILTGSYQMVITDINMPEMDGITFLRWLKKSKPDIEILVMTGLDITEEMLKTIGDTAAEYFIKPPEKVRIRAAIEVCRKKNRRYT